MHAGLLWWGTHPDDTSSIYECENVHYVSHLCYLMQTVTAGFATHLQLGQQALQVAQHALRCGIHSPQVILQAWCQCFAGFFWQAEPLGVGVREGAFTARGGRGQGSCKQR